MKYLRYLVISVLLLLLAFGATGTVKKIIRSKSYGFIIDDSTRIQFRFFFSDLVGFHDRGADVEEGDRVTFEADTTDGRSQALKVKVQKVF